jgi:hypothetical protein
MHIQPDIPDSAWEDAYQQVLLLLKAFPSPLFQVEKRNTCHGYRLVYSQNLVRNPGKEDEGIVCLGDLTSMLTAEYFCLYRHLEHYRKSNTRILFEKSILYTAPESIEYPDAMNGRSIQNGKTQGYPYHFALIAVGILLENLFPGKIVCRGDIDTLSAEKMREWVEQIVKRPIQPLLCATADRLFQTVSKTFRTNIQRVTRFEALFLGSPAEALQTLLTWIPIVDLRAIKASELSSYTANQVGAINAFKNWFAATGDVTEIIRFYLATREACSKKENKKTFKLTALLKTLCNDQIHIPRHERFSLRPGNTPGYPPDILGAMFSMIANIGHSSSDQQSPFVPKSALLEAFASVEPKNRKAFQAIIESTETTLKNAREKAEKPAPDADFDPSALPAHEFVLAQIEHQTHFALCRREKLLKEMTENGNDSFINSMVNSGKKHFASDNDDTQRLGINLACERNGIGLTERAWDWIDHQATTDMLYFVRMFAEMDSQEMTLCRLRCFTFNHPEFLEQCFAASN